MGRWKGSLAWESWRSKGVSGRALVGGRLKRYNSKIRRMIMLRVSLRLPGELSSIVNFGVVYYD